MNATSKTLGKSRRALALINRKSGTVMSRGPEQVLEIVKRILGEGFGAVDAELFEGDIAPEIEKRLKGRGYDVIVAGGGDGTIASAAAALKGSDIVMGALPLGTMNLFVRTLGFSPVLEEALAQLATAEAAAVDVGVANGRVFLHQISFGMQPRMARLRARFGYRSRLTKMLASARAFAMVAANPRSVRVTLEAGGTRADLSTPLLVVSNNPLEPENKLALQERLDTGTLGLYALNDYSIFTLLHIARDYLAGRLLDNPAVDVKRAPSATITRRRKGWRAKLGRADGSMLCSMDGELVHIASPVEITVERGALKVLSLKG